MHSLARGLEKGDLARLALVGNVEDLKASLRLFFGPEALVVDEHDIAAHSHFVGMNAFGHFQLSHELGVLRIAHVDDRSSERRVDMADIGIAVFDHDRAATGKIHPPDHLDLIAHSHRGFSVRCHHVPP